jgi:hypothetical protein
VFRRGTSLFDLFHRLLAGGAGGEEMLVKALFSCLQLRAQLTAAMIAMEDLVIVLK